MISALCWRDWDARFRNAPLCPPFPPFLSSFPSFYERRGLGGGEISEIHSQSRCWVPCRLSLVGFLGWEGSKGPIYWAAFFFFFQARLRIWTAGCQGRAGHRPCPFQYPLDPTQDWDCALKNLELLWGNNFLKEGKGCWFTRSDRHKFKTR